jgi:hypothetical protein
MNTLFAQEVYIRLADDQAGFVYTVKYGKFYAKATEVPLHCPPKPDVLEENVLLLARKLLTFGTPEEQ